jgi:hypothetical protein
MSDAIMPAPAAAAARWSNNPLISRRLYFGSAGISRWPASCEVMLRSK